MATEKTLQSAIMARFGREPAIRIWRSNTGLAKFGSRSVKFGLPGAADISGIIRGGIRLEIEVKSQRGVQGPKQKNYQQMIERLGGCYILARTLDDVALGLSPWLRRPFGKAFERTTGSAAGDSPDFQTLEPRVIYNAIRGLVAGLQMISVNYPDIADRTDAHAASNRIRDLAAELLNRTNHGK